MAKAENQHKARERRILRNYLARFYKAREKSAILQQRLQHFKAEPKNKGGFSPPLSAPEIEARINAQAEAAKIAALEILDILDLLPGDSTERTIMELRHIDCKPWAEICKTVYMTRTPCNKYYNRGLDRLLASEEVRGILGLNIEEPWGRP